MLLLHFPNHLRQYIYTYLLAFLLSYGKNGEVLPRVSCIPNSLIGLNDGMNTSKIEWLHWCLYEYDQLYVHM